MLTKTLMKSRFDRASKQVKHNDQAKLYSFTIKIDPCDPILFYKNNQHLYEGKSFFWKSPDEDFSLVGLGAAYIIKRNSSTSDRFKYIEKKWNKLCEQATIENPYEVPGTGPLLFGGFSFDANSMKEEEWNSFDQSLFYLPEFLLTVVDSVYYVTVNHFSEKYATIEEAKVLIDQLISNAVMYQQSEPVPIIKQEEIEPNDWVEKVEEIVQDLKQTSLQKVVMARKMKLKFAEPANIPHVIQQLVLQQPNSFIFALNVEKSCFLGASPERLVKKTGSEVLSTSLAGSIERGSDLKEDKELEKQLLHDQKNLFEHQLVVSMIKDALGPHCDKMNIPTQPMIMKTPDIQHLYTPVVGQMKPENSILQVLEGLHPTPALGGVPTKDALEIIRKKEEMDRGFYAAPVGWMDYRGNGEFIVAIRSGLIKEDEAYLYAGCGLVSESKPEDELIETRIKFRPMLRATGGN
ncbi:isochorismate synthase [Lederbergia lenta]|uniref:Isochorismate synthase MenF n=1 Tax=Lederbergia lenta TaxID=1467 RepID=A0A2X4WB48_LEDLE|nr:isochorismate synthase [Lederbergia lenta]SQI61386.1 menaquinone-specific isochorismate synthase [Lederbergia lenta]